jgi:DNA/RNA-binding domain of Phe-tRNA-synthetase-like protein
LTLNHTLDLVGGVLLPGDNKIRYTAITMAISFIHDPELTKDFPKNYTFLLAMTNYTPIEQLTAATKKLAEQITSAHLRDVVDPVCNQWATIFSVMQAKPKYRSSLKLLRTLWETHGHLPDINPVVNFYIHYSLVTAAPMGGYNLDRITGDVRLTRAPKGLAFHPLGHANHEEHTKPGEVIYRDDATVLCRYWNLRDCDETKIIPATTNALFFADIIAETPALAEQQAQKIEQDFRAVFGHCVTDCGLTGPGLATSVTLE